ncbi:MAG: hypothetical protein AAGC57_08865 [Pseudomonadota bacterium]
MGDAAQKKWAALDAKIDEALKRFDELEKKLNASPILAKSSAGDRVRAKQKQLSNKVLALRKQIAKLQKDGIFDFSVLGGEGFVEVDGEMAMEVKADTSKLGKARPWNDPTYKKAFSDSISKWCGTAMDDLQNARLAMTKMAGSKGPAAKDFLAILDIVTVAIPNPALKSSVTVIKALATLGTAAYKASKMSSSPKVVEIADAAINYIKAIDKGPHDKAYAELVKQMKAMGYEGDTVWEGEFLPVCKEFAQKSLGPTDKITKKFLTECVKATEDSLDWDGGKAGFADCWMTGVGSSSPGHFGSPGGQLDDVHEGLVTAIKSVYKGKRVIDLPVEIRVTLKTHMGAYKTIVERKSTKEGDASFRMTSGTKSMYEAWMKGKFYESMMISDLQVDT